MAVDVKETLRKADLFAKLDDELLDALSATSTYTRFEPGDQLTQQGAEADGAWVVVEGEIEILRNSVPVNSLGPGDLGGDLSLLSGQPHAVDAVARTPGGRVMIGVDEFRAAVRHRPEVAFEVIRVLVNRIYHIQGLADRTL
ncbi:MAG: Crp/Fnr family transcriptional regulator [Actinomycetota bacterium]|nr:Crp/Fnr family transcriptional regulator [Actinomycetota bacterium]